MDDRLRLTALREEWHTEPRRPCSYRQALRWEVDRESVERFCAEMSAWLRKLERANPAYRRRNRHEEPQ